MQSLRTGQRVYAIGAPQGLELTISDGIVSALREIPSGTVIQTTAPVSPGSSGGGLFDAFGNVVGIVTFQHRFGQNLNFAVPADWIADMRSRSVSTASESTASAPAPSTAFAAPRRAAVAQSQAGGPSAQAIAACRRLGDRTAEVITAARRKGVPPGSLIEKEAENWIRGVQDDMLHAAERAPSLTQSGLAGLGYSYCMERRPANL